MDQEDVSPAHINNLPWYEFEEYIMLLNAKNEKSAEHERKQREQQQQMGIGNMGGFNSMLGSAKRKFGF